MEVILIADEIAAAFPFDGETIHYLNHSKILDALLERIPVKRRSAVLDVLAQHGRLNRSWTKTAGELLKITGISKANIDELGALDVSGTETLIRSSQCSHLIESVSRGYLRHTISNLVDFYDAETRRAGRIGRITRYRLVVSSDRRETDHDLATVGDRLRLPQGRIVL